MPSVKNVLKRTNSFFWAPHSRLIVIDDNWNWSLSWDAKDLISICKNLGIKLAGREYLDLSKNQSVFYLSRYVVLQNWEKPIHRIGFPYYHGKPGSDDSVNIMFDNLGKHHHKISGIQVTNSEMQEYILGTGINPKKVFLIPIGINLDYFSFTTPELRIASRENYGIPRYSVVVGSFQKDGQGWGEGLDPKFIKGPDIFLRTIEILKSQIPELFVMLTGPARGYVKSGLKSLGVPYHYCYLDNYTDIGKYYNALDLYIISSRDEGGPKALLESMASGVPIVTTRVGQAIDLVRHGENGWMVDVEDYEGLAFWAKYAIENRSSVQPILGNGRKTAERNSFSSLIPLWRRFMRGFVDF